MTNRQEADQSIDAAIIELLESGPVEEGELPAAVAIQPDERMEIDRWRAEVRSVAQKMASEGRITLENGKYQLAKD
ncbi:hypothetical protein [Roseobacter sp. HKCCA0434]|uniref:hypothetical protein n=1 Tax=Roseobacter sp. HKCCA0434 TaxID=3079297 RepID=UPI002905D43F|nr:hypothetical protein [Roseobacter sp. HKCCA0434]